MSATGQGPLTTASLSLQADNQKFQQKLTEACSQAAQNPSAALMQLSECWVEVDPLEARELDFLAKSTDAARERWRMQRTQILAAKAQVQFILGQYDESQSTIDLARTYVTSPEDIANSILDPLEAAILQAKG